MKIITIASQKGGVGKSTVCVNLATAMQALGLKTALFDMDSQESSTAWSERRSSELPHVEPVSARRLQTMLGAAEAQGFEVVIIDTPPAASAEAAEAVQLADLVLIPCRPSLLDLDAIKRTARLVATTGRTAYVLINAAPPTATALIDDAQTIAGQTGLAVAPVVLRERSVYRASWPFGLGVVEHEPRGKGAAELSKLMDFIFDELKIIKPSNLKKKRA